MNKLPTRDQHGQFLPQEGTYNSFSDHQAGIPSTSPEASLEPTSGHSEAGRRSGRFNGGFVRDRGEGRGVRVAGPKPTDLSTPIPSEAQERVYAVAKVNGIIRHTQNRERKTKLAVMGIPSAILDRGNPAYAQVVRNAAKYRKSRAKELYQAWGYVSTGVSSLLAAESLALGSSRFLYEIAAELEPHEAQSVLKVAAGLADSARQNGLCAWELCAKESVVRKRNEANNVSAPWLSTGVDGGEKRKPGRPRKENLATEAEMLASVEKASPLPESQGGNDG